MKKKKIIIVLGATATGKSDLAIDLAKIFNGEIISADSRQIYRGMNIGSNKITKQEQQNIKHHLLDIVNPDKIFTLYDWQKLTFKLIKEILAKNKLPIIAGGTGLYISSIVQNYQIPATDLKLRKKLSKQSLTELIRQLKELDPSILKQIDQKNKLKVVRALEYTLSFKENFIEKQKTNECPYDFLIFEIKMDRQMLYKKIDQRVEQMIKQGLLKEVKRIYKKYPDKSLPALNGIGYKEIISYLDKEITLSQAIDLIQKNTRHYTKRQLTWFRRMEKQGLKIHAHKNILDTKKIIKEFTLD